MTKQDYVAKYMEEMKPIIKQQAATSGMSESMSDKLVLGMADIVEEIYDIEELALLCEFYCSPVGKQILTKLPQVEAACFSLGVKMAHEEEDKGVSVAETLIRRALDLREQLDEEEEVTKH